MTFPDSAHNCSVDILIIRVSCIWNIGNELITFDAIEQKTCFPIVTGKCKSRAFWDCKLVFYSWLKWNKNGKCRKDAGIAQYTRNMYKMGWQKGNFIVLVNTNRVSTVCIIRFLSRNGKMRLSQPQVEGFRRFIKTEMFFQPETITMYRNIHFNYPLKGDFLLLCTI